MIYTVTFNPAIDYTVYMDMLKLGEINRTSKEIIYFGGKGITVSTVLHNLGIDNIALGFIAGFTGDYLQENINKSGINTDFIKLKNGITRINLKVKADLETDINTQGPVVGDDEIELFFEKLDVLKKDDILVLAGSVPSTMPDNIYEKIMEKLQNRGIKFIVDAANDLLIKSLKYKPFMIKPNNKELGEIFNVSIESYEDVVLYAKELQERGAVNVLVSRGKDGAVLIGENGKIYSVGSIDSKPKNTTGAGDSMVAGFIAGYILTNNLEYALKLGSACGNATALSDGLATKDLVDKYINLL